MRQPYILILISHLNAVLLTLLILSGCGSSAPENNYRQISMQEAVSIMETEDSYILLDVRTKEEYLEKHIPGAVNLK